MTVLFRSSTEAAARWRPVLARRLPGREIRYWPDLGDPAAIEYAMVWKPEPGFLARLPRLRMILALGAGVDALLGDPTLPRHVPLIRLVDPYMTRAMSEYVVMQVMRLHLQDVEYRAQQAQAVWREREQKNADERRVGILGFGELGQDAAGKLAALGFDVAAWSRTPKQADAITVFSGEDGLTPFLNRSEILVCLLPLTPDTSGILDASRLAALPRGAMIVNAARGGHLVEADLVAALDSGQIGAAVLDVFREEPLPAGHPFWRHPRVIVTPHVAAATNPETAAELLIENIERLEAGRPLVNQVDLGRGY